VGRGARERELGPVAAPGVVDPFDVRVAVDDGAALAQTSMREEYQPAAAAARGLV